MLRVWTSRCPVGVLGRRGAAGATFAYGMPVDDGLAVSITMPVRIASYENRGGLHPVFQMNLPEGALRERLRLDFAKGFGRFDDLDLLGIVGASQVGRVQYTDIDHALPCDSPRQSIEEILRAKADGALYAYLIERFARYSGVSGVQPKVMVRDIDGQRLTTTTATHIVKFWGPEYPELATNEFFCLRAAARAGLDVPRVQLSANGGALVVERFDLDRLGVPRGFEDFCVLNGVGTDRKYDGGYEKRLFHRLREVAEPDGPRSERQMLRHAFTMVALNCGLQNGDAHLKNFGVLYDDVRGPVSLAPAYDLISTTPYLPKDLMALTIEGTKRWPSGQTLEELGQRQAGLSVSETRDIMLRCAQAIEDTLPEMEACFAEKPEEARTIGARIAAAWRTGLAQSLKPGQPKRTMRVR